MRAIGLAGWVGLCLKNECTYVGCQSDKECQIYLGTTGNGKLQVVCRDKVAK
jgi:hypothetical protein